MKKILHPIPIFLLALLLAAAAVFCVPSGVAEAASPRFVIVCGGERDWSLFIAGGNEPLLTSDKVFFDPDSDSVAGDDFMHAIHDWLDENGYDRADYFLTFELTGFEAVAQGSPTIAYDAARDGDFGLTASVTSVINPKIGADNLYGMLQFRRADGEYAEGDTHGRADRAGDKITFGRVPAGNYFVRYIAVERFTFDDRYYEVRRASDNEFSCTVEKSVAPIPSVDSTSAEYGTAAGDISMYGGGGRWTFSATQPSGIDAGDRLEVSDAPYTVYFDFTSNDENYLPREGVPVKVTITPRTLRVYIGDIFSLQGEPMADLTKLDHAIGQLVEGDTEEDLGLEFYLTREFEPDKAGVYGISARITNKNYTCLPVSLLHTSIPGGQYTVYRYKYEATAPDGRAFTVYCDSLTNVSLAIETPTETLRLDGDVPEGATAFYYESKAVYDICFYDSLRRRVYPSGSYSAEWEGEVRGATFMAILSDREGFEFAFEDLKEYDGTLHAVTFQTDEDSVAFFAAVTEYPSENIWQWYNILLLALCCALFVATLAMFVIIAIRRRGIWK